MICSNFVCYLRLYLSLKLRGIAFMLKKAFTLIELLIVISVIGILAGIVIAVIDPIKQKEKAQEGVIVATMSKIVLAIEAYYAVYGVYPDCGTLLGDLSGGVNFQTCTIGSNQGAFAISGVAMPNDCNMGGYMGAEDPCSFRYEVDNPNGQVCVHARTFTGKPYPLYLLWKLDPLGTSTSGIIETNESCRVWDIF